ncbi:hypothetical protein Gpo141_00013961, partial [Globisporangium polare]
VSVTTSVVEEATTTTTSAESVEDASVSAAAGAVSPSEPLADEGAAFGEFGAFEAHASSSESEVTTSAEFGSFAFSSEPVGVVGGDDGVGGPGGAEADAFSSSTSVSVTTSVVEEATTTTTSAESVEDASTGGADDVPSMADDEFERMLEATPAGAVVDPSDFDFDAAIEGNSGTSSGVPFSSDEESKSALHLAEEVDELLGGQIEDAPGTTYTLDEVDSEIETLFSPSSAQGKAAESLASLG